MDPKEVQQRIHDKFGSRESFLAWQIVQLSQTGQPTDITFYNRPPILDVKVDQQIALALSYGAGAEKFAELMNRIKFSNGSTAGLMEIWTINPMPNGGFTDAELHAVDMSEAEEPSGPNGETLRQMIRETYQCKSRADEDKYLRRFIAS